MGLIHRGNPRGIDIIIDRLQRDLFIELSNRFCWKGYTSYDRVYRNRKEKDTLPEYYIGDGDYKEVLFNDRKTVTSFFLSDEKRTYDAKNLTFTQGISIVFQANLKELFPNIVHRADEELIDNVIRAIKNKGWDMQFVEVITGVEKVYESLKLSNEKRFFDDMSSFNLARFNFKVNYIITKCETTKL